MLIKADTAEEVKHIIVEWLKLNASNHRIQALKVDRINRRNVALAIANTYQDAADFLERSQIETKS